MITAFYKKNLKKISEGKKNDAAYNVKRKNSQSRCETGRIKLCGSITIDPKLMEAAGILEYEQVQIVDVENGNRFETYTIDGEPGSGMICLNGAAARQVQVGDHVIIMHTARWMPKKPQTTSQRSSLSMRKIISAAFPITKSTDSYRKKRYFADR